MMLLLHEKRTKEDDARRKPTAEVVEAAEEAAAVFPQDEQTEGKTVYHCSSNEYTAHSAILLALYRHTDATIPLRDRLLFLVEVVSSLPISLFTSLKFK